MFYREKIIYSEFKSLSRIQLIRPSQHKRHILTQRLSLVQQIDLRNRRPQLILNLPQVNRPRLDLIVNLVLQMLQQELLLLLIPYLSQQIIHLLVGSKN